MSTKIIRQYIDWLEKQPSPVIFTQKDFEKRFGTKQPSSMVRDNLNELVNENLIEINKCGNVNIFYYYRNQKVLQLQEENNKLDVKLTVITIENNRMELEVAQLESERKSFKGKENKLRQLKSLQQEYEQLLKELDKLRDESISRDDVVNKMNAINDLTKKLQVIAENIEILISYFHTKYQVENADLRKEFLIPQEFHDIDLKKDDIK